MAKKKALERRRAPAKHDIKTITKDIEDLRTKIQEIDKRIKNLEDKALAVTPVYEWWRTPEDLS